MPHEPTILEPTSPWLDTAVAARYLGKAPGTLKGWRSKGEGPIFHAVSRQFIRYHIDDLDAFVRGGSAKKTSHQKSTCR
ncbi:DNA-binding protein [Mesorhizobium sp. NBSH29]|uniref:helix-turn-helix domain-containing protein n=1 Tax=Mesorhizobium sp. NBSH29 TaxID=2654249 RepID=UPI0018966F18|nr:helix-turn-helix domain-containing protein [Mesorhizobium sp. NBSH29]QPC85706.1 DNA-binding protein [Mesorhizobium sp. NBSH29]